MDEPGTSALEMRPRDALALAIELHRLGRLREAEQVYDVLLRLTPDDPDLLHYLGVLRHQFGRSEEGLALIRRSLGLCPGNPHALRNLGNVLKETGRPGEAAAAYAAALEIDPVDAGTLSNLGAVHKALGRLDEAESALRRALELRPDFAPAHHNLGNVLARRGRPDDAARSFREALRLRPDDGDARRALAESLVAAGRLEDAARVFDEWLALDPGNESARYLRAAVLGHEVPERAPDSFVRSLFGSLAADFDARLADLGYRAPELVLRALEARLGPSATGLAILDAGCGTGLCGPPLRPRAARLVGVDLSPEMLRAADARRVYDQLVAAELTAYLRETAEGFDAIVSADTLCYFGALGPVFAGAGRVLRPGGVFVFTVEHSAGDESSGFRLHARGRYCHAEGYVRGELARAGLTTVAVQREVLRHEAGVPVDGLLVSAKPGRDDG
ncbi:MAG: tetratricopeptide repeat protein [Acidobacteria bacterium]|nr:tetratricopeptide repeat protein [Acidobacteriota bacterium]